MRRTAVMVRVMRTVTAVLMVWLWLGLPADAAAEPTAGPPSLSVPMPSGSPLAPGTYDVSVTGTGRQFRTKVTVGVPTPSRAPAEDASAGTAAAVSVAVVAVIALALFGGLAAFVYRTQISGRRTEAAYRQLLSHVDAGRYRQALPGLTRIEATLPDSSRSDARFYIAFALYQIGDLDDAEYRLSDLVRENPDGREAAYLLAYIKLQRRDFDGAERAMSALVGKGVFARDAEARKLYSVIEFQRALEALKADEIETAAVLFERVQRLGYLREKVPIDLRNRHAALGARALFNKDIPTARKHFQHLEQAAEGMDAVPRAELTASAKLGLALAAYIEDDPKALAGVDSLLVDAIRLIDPAARTARAWPASRQPAGLADRLESLAAEGDESEESKERRRTVRDAQFLRAMAVLRAWPVLSPTDLDRFLGAAIACLACARHADPTFADVHLVVGFLYHHFGDSEQKAQCLELLREARRRGARDPELVRILNRYEERMRSARPAVEALELIDLYLDDDSVRLDIRQALLRQRERAGRIRSDDPGGPVSAAAKPPTVADLRDRAEMLAARVRMLGAGRPALVEMAQRLEAENDRLTQQLQAMRDAEAELVMQIGNALLADEER